jgi:hypothetical protein
VRAERARERESRERERERESVTVILATLLLAAQLDRCPPMSGASLDRVVCLYLCVFLESFACGFPWSNRVWIASDLDSFLFVRAFQVSLEHRVLEQRFVLIRHGLFIDRRMEL